MTSTLCRYAEDDARAAGLSLPRRQTDDELASYMAVAGHILFQLGDPNLDNQKRNIAIQVFLQFDAATIFAFGLAWLQRWKQNCEAPWYKEWEHILQRGSPAELYDILLSHEQERVRQRTSMPFAEMLGFERVLEIKRKWRRE